jgi:hypothetical protein
MFCSSADEKFSTNVLASTECSHTTSSHGGRQKGKTAHQIEDGVEVVLLSGAWTRKD